jgi:hypothetical protein
LVVFYFYKNRTESKIITLNYYYRGEGIVVAERKSVDHDWNQWGCCKMEEKDIVEDSNLGLISELFRG